MGVSDNHRQLATNPATTSNSAAVHYDFVSHPQKLSVQGGGEGQVAHLQRCRELVGGAGKGLSRFTFEKLVVVVVHVALGFLVNFLLEPDRDLARLLTLVVNVSLDVHRIDSHQDV